MVAQQIGQQCAAGEQSGLVDRQFGQQQGKRVIGRGEHCQRAGRRQGVLQIGGHDGLHQNAELRQRLCGLQQGLVGRQQHPVNAVHHAVAGLAVGADNFGGAVAAVSDGGAIAHDIHLEDAALQRADRLAGRNLGPFHLARQDMVGQHRGQQGFIGQQLGFGYPQLCQQSRHGCIVRCQQGEWAATLQGCDQVGRDHGLHQDAEVRVGLGQRHQVRWAGGARGDRGAAVAGGAGAVGGGAAVGGCSGVTAAAAAA